MDRGLPLEMSTHQEYPVEPRDWIGSKVPSDLHCGTYAPSSPELCEATAVQGLAGSTPLVQAELQHSSSAEQDEVQLFFVALVWVGHW